MPDLDSTPDLLAARLALLALRATIGESAPLGADRVGIGSASPALTADAAARVFASLPKPVVCDAEARDGTLVVHCWPLSESDAFDRQRHEKRQRDDEKRGGFMPYLDDHYGDGDHLIAVFGGADSLFVAYSVVNRFSREYEIRGMNYVGDDVRNPLALDHPDYISARQRGAKGRLRFIPNQQSGEALFSSINIYSDSNVDLPKEAEGYLVEMACASRMLLQALIADAASDEPPRAGSNWESWSRKAFDAQRMRLTQTALMLKTVLKGKPMPREVVEFVDECEKYFGPQSS